MKAITNFLKTIGLITENKIVKKTEDLISENPEVALENAIREEEKRKNENINKASEIKVLLKENEKIVTETKNKLVKIQTLIAQQDKLGNKEEVTNGTALYLKRKEELITQEQVVKKIKDNYEKIESIIKEQVKKIETYKTKKDVILSQLKVAETQKKAMDILAGISENDDLTKSFDSTNKIIESRINKLESISETYDSISSTKKDDPFAGL